MEPRQRLAANLDSESMAYGYTLTIWGAGAILLSQYGTPTVPQIFGYVGGAVLGFGLLTAVAFDAPFSDVAPEGGESLVASSLVHVLATLGNLLVTLGVVATAQAVGLPAIVTFVLVGVQATVLCNLLLLVEEAAARWTASVAGTTTGETD